MSSGTTEIREIEALLLNYLDVPNTKILKQDIRLLTAPGENYGSVMQAVDVTIQEPEDDVPRVLHLVAKRLPANEFLCKAFNIQETFKKEMLTYLQLVPALVEFQQEFGHTGNKQFSNLFAKCYGARINLNPSESEVVDEDAVIFLENLKIAGYDVGDRLVGFDEEDAYKILEDLARFHAIPIAFRIIHPERFEEFVKPAIKTVIFDDFSDYSEELLQATIDEVLDVLKEHNEFAPYLDKVSQTIMKNLEGDYRYIEGSGPFSTVCHSDYWVNNTMLLRDELGKPIGNKILDFQIAIYNTCVRDLLFFLYSSVKPDILDTNIDTFIKFYHKCFLDCLDEFEINLDEYSWENFEEEISKHVFMELGHVLIMYSPIIADRGVIDDMAKFDYEYMMKHSNKSDEYKRRVVYCVSSFIKQKWL